MLRSLVGSEMCIRDRYSTEMYRAPEMCDLYAQQLISEKVDVWALGALIYTLAYWKQPFQDCGAFGIANANVPYPDNGGLAGHPPSVADLIRWCLTKDPEQRPSMSEIVPRVQELLAEVKKTSKTSTESKPKQGNPTVANTQGSQQDALRAKLAREVEEAEQRLAGGRQGFSPFSSETTAQVRAQAGRSARPKKPKEVLIPHANDTSLDMFAASLQADWSSQAASQAATSPGFADFGNMESAPASSPGFADFASVPHSQSPIDSTGFADFGNMESIQASSPGFADFGDFSTEQAAAPSASDDPFGDWAGMQSSLPAVAAAPDPSGCDDVEEFLAGHGAPSQRRSQEMVPDLLSPSGAIHHTESLDDLLQ
eukprot:TRINITY_DN9942_c0_g1_i3.p1 TRINITY_DN9942_c0_g1~~TRINITY_DN9942_c0_g1_i3.p1  ORF type:complete len:369 (+),score=75.17 TRINITY_DN9942_c0_g1_i3:156-1262(+)